MDDDDDGDGDDDEDDGNEQPFCTENTAWLLMSTMEWAFPCPRKCTSLLC